MITIDGDDINDIYIKILETILLYHVRRTARKMETLELHPVVITLSKPLNNKVNFVKRGLNRAFRSAEFLWIMSGSDDAEWIGRYNSRILDYADVDGGKRFFGAYGPQIMNGLPYVIDKLKSDIGTRQAVITTWKNNPPNTKDVPCTISLNFMASGYNDGERDYLDLTVYMRSNDAWLGFPYDVYNFTMILNYVATMAGMGIGRYFHVANSLHLYTRDMEKVTSLLVDRRQAGQLYSPPLTDDKHCYLNDAIRVVHNLMTTESSRVYGLYHLPQGWINVLTPIKEFWDAKRKTS